MSISSSSSSLILFFFLITAVQYSIIIYRAHSTTHPHDVQLLKQLKSTITPTSIPQSSCVYTWDFTLDPCDNLFTQTFTCGFRCDVVSHSLSRVTELALDSPGYSGSLTSLPFTNLRYLQSLDFSNNHFTGAIPESISNLTRLNRLALSHNSLSGSIPGSISSLEEMYLDNNFFTGAIPVDLNGLMNLKRLELQGNQLSGQLPELSQLGNLNFLDVSDNAISGELPAVLPPSLIEFVMRNNQLEGNIPATVENVPSLQVMDLSNNKFSGSIPAGLFAHPSLEQLTLSFNRFGSVQVPGDSGLSSQLISIDLSNNELSGFLPVFMGLMPRLSALSLENNKFSGLIPTEYVLKVLFPGSGQFERLLLGGNYLFGPIPGGFMDLKPGSVTVRLGDNCLYRCPLRLFFCEGGVQKSTAECKAFGPIIP